MRGPARLVVLLVVAGAFPATPGAAQDVWRLEDARGDPTLGHAIYPDITNVPVSVLTDPVDILSVTFASEDHDRLMLILSMADLKTRGGAAQAFVYWKFEFQVTGIGNGVRYKIEGMGYSSLGLAGGPQTIASRACVQSACLTTGGFTLDPGQNRILWEIRKSPLAGLDEEGKRWSDAVDPQVPLKGLQDWSLNITRREGFFLFGEFTLTDRVVGSQPLLFHLPTANLHVRLGKADATYRDPGLEWAPFYEGRVDASVPVGGTTEIRLPLANLRPQKRIVNLSLDAPLPRGWHAALPAHVELPASSAINITLRITAPADAVHRSQASVNISGRSIGHPEEVVFERLVVAATASWDPQGPRFRFHAAKDPAQGAVACPEELCRTTWTWMNPIETDAAADRDANGFPMTSWTADYKTFHAGVAFGQDIPRSSEYRAQRGEPAVVAFVLRAEATYTANATASVWVTDPSLTCHRSDFPPCGHGDLFARATRDITLQPGENTLEFTMPQRTIKSWPTRPHVFVATLMLGTTDPSFLRMQGDSVRVLPSKGWLKLPAEVEPEPAVPTLLRLYGGDEAEFVNPLETRLFRIRLANEGNATERVRLAASVSEPGWGVSLRPGDRFQLAPGEGVNLGVLVQAPAKAREGTTVNVNLTAVSESGTGPPATRRLEVIYTEGADVADDARAFQADEDSSQRLVQAPAGRSPSTALLVLLVVLAGLAAVRRRHGCPE